MHRLLTLVLFASLASLGACAVSQDDDAGSAAATRSDAAAGTGNDPSGTPDDLGAQFGGEPDVPGRAEPRYPSLGAPAGGRVAAPGAFSQWDADADGFISREEAKDQPIEPAFADIDQDRDGRVSPQEFGRYQESHGPRQDRPHP